MRTRIHSLIQFSMVVLLLGQASMALGQGMKMLSGRVYEGPTGSEPPTAKPIEGVTVKLYGSTQAGVDDHTKIDLTFLRETTTDQQNGWYGLEVYPSDTYDYFNIIQTNKGTYVDSDPPGATAAFNGGTVKSPNWIQYGYGDIFYFDKTLTGNKFWDRLANRPPVANPDLATTMRDTAVTIFVLANDPLTITNVTSPPHGTATHNGQRVTYTPQSGWTGSDSFSYTISDGRGGTATARVSVTVNPPANRPPVAVDDFYSVQAGQTLMVAAIGMLGNDTDPDGDTLTANIDAHAKSPHG